MSNNDILKGKTWEEINNMVSNEDDFILLRRYGYSLQKLVDKYPDGCPDHIIATALGVDEAAVKERFSKIITCLRDRIGVL
jgi:hypothetical protein